MLRGTVKKIRQIKKEKEADMWDPVILFIMVLKGHYVILSNFSNQIKNWNGSNPCNQTRNQFNPTKKYEIRPNQKNRTCLPNQTHAYAQDKSGRLAAQ